MVDGIVALAKYHIAGEGKDGADKRRARRAFNAKMGYHEEIQDDICEGGREINHRDGRCLLRNVETRREYVHPAYN